MVALFLAKIHDWLGSELSSFPAALDSVCYLQYVPTPQGCVPVLPFNISRSRLLRREYSSSNEASGPYQVLPRPLNAYVSVLEGLAYTCEAES